MKKPWHLIACGRQTETGMIQAWDCGSRGGCGGFPPGVFDFFGNMMALQGREGS